MTQTLIIDGELTDLNTYINAERRNRFIAAKIKKEETYKVKSLSRTLKQIFAPVEVEIHWYSKNIRKDPDNICYAKKYVMDGLVEAGVLANDGQKQIVGFRDKFFVDKLNPRVEVTLREKPL